MPTDETRRLLKMFGVAVTALEDAVHERASAEHIAKAEKDVRAHLEEIHALIDRLRQDAATR
jgi:signal transduction histidine kinase